MLARLKPPHTDSRAPTHTTTTAMLTITINTPLPTRTPPILQYVKDSDEDLARAAIRAVGQIALKASGHISDSSASPACRLGPLAWQLAAWRRKQPGPGQAVLLHAAAAAPWLCCAPRPGVRPACCAIYTHRPRLPALLHSLRRCPTSTAFSTACCSSWATKRITSRQRRSSRWGAARAACRREQGAGCAAAPQAQAAPCKPCVCAAVHRHLHAEAPSPAYPSAADDRCAAALPRCGRGLRGEHRRHPAGGEAPVAAAVQPCADLCIAGQAQMA